MVGMEKTFADRQESLLKKTLENLKALQERQIEQIERKFQESRELERVKLARKEKRTTQVRRVFDEYKAWVEETMTTEPEPFIQVPPLWFIRNGNEQRFDFDEHAISTGLFRHRQRERVLRPSLPGRVFEGDIRDLV